VTRFDDYEDEMTLWLISEEDIDRLFDGTAPAGDDSLGDLARLLRRGRDAFLVAPDEHLEASHITAIVHTALETSVESLASPSRYVPRQATGVALRTRMTRSARSFLLRFAAGTAASVLSVLGFAYAGIDLPGTALEETVEAILGIDLPNQGEDVGSEEKVGRMHQPDRAKDLRQSSAPNHGRPGRAGATRDRATTHATVDEGALGATSGYETGMSIADEWSGGWSSTGRAIGESAAGTADAYKPGPGADSGADAKDWGQGHNPASESDGGERPGQGPKNSPGGGPPEDRPGHSGGNHESQEKRGGKPKDRGP